MYYNIFRNCHIYYIYEIYFQQLNNFPINIIFINEQPT
jgi:hypothetical protein